MRACSGTTRKCIGAFETVKPAPDLKTSVVDASRIQKAGQNMLYRYWSLRLKEKEA